MTCRPARAHEVGTTKAVITIADGRYSVDVSTDATALLARLEASAGEEISGPLEADEYQRRLRVRADGLLRHLELRFGEIVVRPSVDVAVSADEFAIAKARFRLRGSLPAAARTVSWRYDLAATTYELDVLSNGQLEAQWLEGGQRSRPAALIGDRGPQPGALGAFRLGFGRIIPGGIDQILFILALVLAGRRGITKEFLAFALAESLAFALTISGVMLSRPFLPGASRLIAPLVALSIACMAGERLVAPVIETGHLARVFVYGLVHGIALSPMLSGLGGAQTAASNLLVALVTSIAGVQASQLT
ncbi:MAG TPA: HupE/UreJ family protein, partial [Vicinamibacterales bacterium]